MTAVIRFYDLHSEQWNAQLGEKDPGKVYVCAFKDKSERVNDVHVPGGSE